MTTDWLMILLGVALTAGTALFVCSEFSLVALDPAAVDRVAENGTARDRSVRQALRHLSTELSGAQVGITLTTILLGYTTQPALVRLLSEPLAGIPHLASTAASGIAVVLGLILVNVFSMIFGELVPKNWALADPMRSARAVAPLQRGFTVALRPMIVVLNGSANAILRLFGVEPREELSGARSPQELAALVRRSAEVGTLPQGTATLLTRSIALEDLSAVDVMTDRTRLKVVGRDDTAEDVIALARSTGHSRFPVVEDSVDDIVGLVNLRRAISVPYDRRAEVPVAALMVPAPQVPETVRLGPLLVELRDHGLQMAVVVDEYGGTAGVVTLEDVVEELVGDVADEHDRHATGHYAVGPDAWNVPGVMRPDELAQATGVRVPENPAYETLGGLVMAALGRLPVAGDVVEVPGVRLRVEAMDGRRVERLRVQRRRPPAEEADDREGDRRSEKGADRRRDPVDSGERGRDRRREAQDSADRGADRRRRPAGDSGERGVEK